MEQKDHEGVSPEHGLIPADDFLIVELDDRFEFGAAVIETDLIADDNYGCNGTNCHVNAYMCNCGVFRG